MWSDWLVFCDGGFQSVCPLLEKDKRLMEASWWERLTEKETGSYFGAMLSKSLIQFSVDGWGCVPSLLFTWGQNYGGGNEDNGDLLQKILSRESWTLTGKSGSVSLGSLLLSPGSWCTKALFVVMFPKAHLTSHSRMSGSRWVITPPWLSRSWRSILYSSLCILATSS